ncbi:MAG: signal peptide peptidase SppA [Flavobacteriales bacterium]|nr:signal peptide peptidase SppA [Flavobacteriales bacterium]MCX7768427.1 signal peptide peptidase SppA [Flavobacteriales bacterium]MDW8409680.1 signal peptide peptidase SppA [Flavobacteriales bacterium]
MSGFSSSFWGAVVGVLVGFFISLAALFVFGFILFGIVASGLEQKAFSPEVEKGTFLHLKLSGAIPDKPIQNTFKKIWTSFQGEDVLSLPELLEVIYDAKDNPDIKGIFLDNIQLSTGWATLEELRQALVDFRTSGKPILAYADWLDQANYYLASLSDRLFLNPSGSVAHIGLTAQFISFKGMLDKLGIKAQVIRPDSNAFKSAAESFIYEKMSPENRLQLKALVASMWTHITASIADTRKTSPDSVRAWANRLDGLDPELAYRKGLVDGLRYYDQIVDTLKILTGTGKEPPRLILASDYFKRLNKVKAKKDKKIVILFAEGEIVDENGSNDENKIVGARYAELLRKARADENVKGIVLRVNSPGGSALASDLIHREVILTRAVKPVYVSMGNRAASGGYYISCGADSIFADYNTITGSIGVFGLLPDLSELLNQKLGIRRDTVSTEKFSDSFTLGKPLTKEEFSIFKKTVERVYQRFLEHVARGRRMTWVQVRRLAQGRVWGGSDALQVGLVDRLTGLQGVVTSLKRTLGSDNVHLEYWPSEEDFWKRFFGKNVISDIFFRQLFSQFSSPPEGSLQILDYEALLKTKIWARAPEIQVF